MSLTVSLSLLPRSVLIGVQCGREAGSDLLDQLQPALDAEREGTVLMPAFSDGSSQATRFISESVNESREAPRTRAEVSRRKLAAPDDQGERTRARGPAGAVKQSRDPHEESCLRYVAGTAASCRSVTARMRLWASANHRSAARTLRRPRTENCCKPRLRASAFTHSLVAARSL